MGLTNSYLNTLNNNVTINIFENTFSISFNSKSAKYQPEKRLHNYYEYQDTEYYSQYIPLVKIHRITNLRVTDYLAINFVRNKIIPNHLENIKSALLELLSNINCRYVIFYNMEFVLPIMHQLRTCNLYMLMISLPKLIKENRYETLELLKKVKENNRQIQKIVLSNLDVTSNLGNSTKFEVEIGDQLIYTDLKKCEAENIPSLIDSYKELPSVEEQIPRLLTNNLENITEFETANLSINDRTTVMLESGNIRIVGWPDISKIKVTQKLRVLIYALNCTNSEVKNTNSDELVMLEKYISSCNTHEIIFRPNSMDLIIPIIPVIKPIRAEKVLIFVWLPFKVNWQVVDMEFLREIEQQMCYFVKHYEISEMRLCVAYEIYYSLYYDFRFTTDVTVNKNNLDDENHITGLQEDFNNLDRELKDLYKPPPGW